MSYKIGVIGFGNIAKAIITPLLDKKIINPDQIYCSVRSKKTFENIKNNYKYKVNLFKADSEESRKVWECPIKLLSIKPQQLNNINELIFEKEKKKTIISILAGVSINNLEKRFPNHNCVRTVTNIPITIGRGLTGISWSKKVDKDHKIFIKKIFEKSSKVYEFHEDYLDIFLALTSSSPAIIALIIEALSDGGLSGGLQKELSEELVLDMMLGTILLLKDSNISTSELKNMVTSPGGTTISAIRVLEKRSFRSALIESIISASNRSKEFR